MLPPLRFFNENHTIQFPLAFLTSKFYPLWMTCATTWNLISGLPVFWNFPEFRKFDHQIGTYQYYFKNKFFSGGEGTSANQYAIS